MCPIRHSSVHQTRLSVEWRSSVEGMNKRRQHALLGRIHSRTGDFSPVTNRYSLHQQSSCLPKHLWQTVPLWAARWATQHSQSRCHKVRDGTTSTASGRLRVLTRSFATRDMMIDSKNDNSKSSHDRVHVDSIASLSVSEASWEGPLRAPTIGTTDDPGHRSSRTH